MIGVDEPLWLLLLAPVAALAVLAWRREGATRRARLATALRLAAAVLLVLALAAPWVAAGGRGVDVAFLVDASHSVGERGRADALAWAREAMDARGAGDRAGLALFGRSPRVAHGLREDPPADAPAVVVDASATDLAAAARLAQGMLGSERRRRVVLLSDGRETQRDLLAAADALAEAGIALDVVPLAAGAQADVLVERIEAPNRAREGEAYDVVARVRSTSPDPVTATVVVTADGVEVARRDVEIPAASHHDVAVEATAGEPGTVRWEARVSSAASSAAENDVGRAAVQVAGPARVLLAEGTAGLGDELAAALDAAGIGAEVRDVAGAGLPTLDRLLDYDAVVLVDVPAPDVGADGMAALDAYVRDAGRGLVVVGGERSYGVGGYVDTPLEELLPVFATVTDPQRRPDVAQALVVDSSGSMAACHCADEEGFGRTDPVEAGVRKTEIAKEAVARALAALESQDTVGVLAFDHRTEWVVPLQQLPSQEVIDDALARIEPRGDTATAPAVRRAIEGLRDVDARLRHIVLFTDGFDSAERGLVEVAREAAEAGVTLSVVGTGEGTTPVLEEMAEAGGGRFYPGRDLFSIPDIIATEVSFAARPVVTEGTFFPAITGVAPPTEDLEETPPLHGYLATTRKPTARGLLAVGEHRDPLLATWQAGLGSVAAWTSDATGRWAADWVGWEGFPRFWSDVVGDVLPDRDDPGFALSATATADGVRVRMDVTDDVGAEAEAVATVTGPEGERHELRLDRVGLDAFEATLPGAAEGVHAVTGRLVRGDETLRADTAAAIVPYPAEYAPAGADPDLLARAASRTDGRVAPAPADVFDPSGLARGTASRGLWPLLAALALALAVADVGVRRLRLERADWGRARAWLAARLRRRRPDDGDEAGPPRTERGARLLAARDRARTQQAGRPADPEDER